ncbi:hypothetical protein BBJ28_00017395 [Nothophytophthora sp. Chile5]|nr:hypothetical protein BBJ28_00017395 [Nothophytophthora sp. Chile5]
MKLPSVLGRQLTSVHVTLGLLSLAAALLYSSSRSSKTKPAPNATKRVPYLPSLPILGNALDLKRNGHRFLEWLTEQCLSREGLAFTLRNPGRGDLLVTANPEHYEQVMKIQVDNFIKGKYVQDVLADVLGCSLMNVDGEHWKFQRRVVANLFSSRLLREHMTPIVQKHMKNLQNVFSNAATAGERIDAYKLMHRFTLEAFAEIGFGCELGSLASGQEHPFETAFDDAQRFVAVRSRGPVLLWKLKRWLNVGSERQLRNAMAVIDELVMSFISKAIERRQLRSEGDLTQILGKDIVSIILDSVESNGQVVEPVEVRDIAVAALVGGRDTTAGALSWLFHTLTKHPRVEAKLRAELLTKLPKLGESDDYVPSLEEVQELPYLEATIHELLRLLPPLAFTGRFCATDTVFPDGTFVPSGTSIWICYCGMARLTSLWGPDAAEFVPERFIDSETGAVLQFPPSKFSAFNVGPRICPGRTLAWLEMKIVVACLVSRFHLVEPPGQETPYSIGITVGMKNPLMVSVERVAAGTSAAAASG